MQAEEIAEEPLPEEGTARVGQDGSTLVELQAMIQAWSFINPDVPDELCTLFEQFLRPGELCDFFVFHFIRKVAEKQKYLDRAGIGDRAASLLEFLRKDLPRQARRQMRARRGILSH